jgi:hypothetical protein
VTTASLDCESYESSIECLARLYGTKVRRTERFLSYFDLEAEYSNHRSLVSDHRFLAERFESEFGQPALALTSVCWFHLTRIPPNTGFIEGILPLDLALPKIWQAIIAAQADIGKKKRLERLRRQGVQHFQYGLKVGVTYLGGPYAMLVRETAFHAATIGNHDYLRTPEIIDDICRGYEKRYGESILEQTLRDFRRCIVKFELPETDGDTQHLKRVLIQYCWAKCRDEELTLYCNTCFDGQGKTIPRTAIRKIEFL